MSAVRGRNKNFLRPQIFLGEVIAVPCSAGTPPMRIILNSVKTYCFFIIDS